MTDNVEPQTAIAGAVEEKEKTTEESTTTTEAPESEQDASTEKTGGGGDAKAEEKKETAPAEEAPGSAVESDQNGVTDAKANEGGEKAETTSKEKQKEEKPGGQSTASSSATPVVSSSKLSRPPYKYDPNKITLRFLFANRDGLTVTVECTPSDTVAEVKGALLSVWPEGKIVVLTYCVLSISLV
jgi:hypothetical protein